LALEASYDSDWHTTLSSDCSICSLNSFANGPFIFVPVRAKAVSFGYSHNFAKSVLFWCNGIIPGTWASEGYFPGGTNSGFFQG